MINAENSLVLCVYGINSVAALAEVKGYGIVVTVVVDPEHCRTVGSDSVGLVEKTCKAIDLFRLQIGRSGSRFAQTVLVCVGAVSVESIQIVIDVL